ncbi:MAG: DUF2891 domain-containing protein [Phycisphaeraceae bacterium]|nr:DUF2891 domain-containing protein [Phycisphaeraceae bacterium]
MATLNEHIDRFVALAASHIDREYPHKLDHVIRDAGDLRSPRQLHPVFYGSFDWHSSVHAHWVLVRALRLSPGLGAAGEIRALLDRRLTEEAVAGEVAYLRQPGRGAFERPYGWAWLLKLAAELRLGATGGGGFASAMARWEGVLAPLTAAFVERFLTFLPRATYSVRVGMHQNSAFALRLALDYAAVSGEARLDAAIRSKARAWFAGDRACPTWEPDGADFLSPSMCEAELMRRVMEAEEFGAWLRGFWPRLGEGEPGTLFRPAEVSDRTDGQIAHLDGLNLSRAWCWRSLATAMGEGDARRALAIEAYRTHVNASLPHIAGDYAGEHWLATFAMLALTE